MSLTLNEEQMRAVAHPMGRPACLIAGAGSGKTATITERVAWLLREGVHPSRLAAITFTNKAAAEIMRRVGVDKDTPWGIRPHISTIHSLALTAIRKDSEGFGFTGKITPMDDYDQSQMLKKLVEREPPEEGTDVNIYRFLDKLGYHRARGIGFSLDYTEEVHEDALERHAGYHALEEWETRLWMRFECEKQKNGCVDFDDMVHLFVRRGETDEAWRTALQGRFDHVLQDESQDTSPVQWKLINLLLAPDNPNLYAVGDLAQSIYAFQGAEPRLLKEFSEGWRGLVPDLYRIARNHRSLPSIIRLANRINATMKEVIPLKMLPFRGIALGGPEKELEHGTTRLLRASLPNDIACTIASEIKHDSQVKTNTITYGENAILVRSAIQVRDLEGALVRFRIPYVVRGGKGLLQTEEIKDLLSYFRLAVNPKDFTAMGRAAGAPKRGVGDVALEKIRKVAQESHGGNLIEACKGVDKLSMFRTGMLMAMERLNNPQGAIEHIVEAFDYRGYITKKYFREAGKVATKIDNIKRFLILVGVLVEDNGLSADDLVFQLALDRPAEKEEEGVVTISTIHSAKGLEWKRVYVTNCTEGSLPHRFSMGSDSEVEEERRLFYVACTRARDHLAVCVNAMEQNGPNVRSVAPSRFLREVGIIQ